MIPQSALPAGFSGDRAYGTAIYFLLGAEDFSAFHRLQADEVWHFYSGGRLEISVIHPRDDGWRVGEYETFGDPGFGEWLTAQPFELSGMRPFRDRLRAA